MIPSRIHASEQIFTSEEVELPRQGVADFLETIDPAICSRFVEYLLNEKGDVSALFHNRLAELYLRMTMTAKKRGDAGTRQAMKAKLLQFIDTTSHYQVDRLFGLLPSDGEYQSLDTNLSHLLIRY